METTKDAARHDLVNGIAKHRSALLVVAWALDALATEVNPSDSDSERMELYDGLVSIVELLAQQSHEVYGKLNKEIKPAR